MPVLIISATIQPILDELDRILSKLFPLPQALEKYLESAMDSLRTDSLAELIIIIFGAVIIAGISEELLFRGFLQRSFEQEGSPLRAIMISSLVFAFVHFSPQFLQIFLLG